MRFFTCLSFLGICINFVTSANMSCADGWSRYAKRCLRLYTSIKSYSSAESYCDIEGRTYGKHGHLVNIESSTLLMVLQTLTSQFHHNLYWIGADDLQEEGIWKNKHNRAVSWSYWYPSQPDGGTAENCAVMDSAQDHKWYDKRCSNSYRFICEYLLLATTTRVNNATNDSVSENNTSNTTNYQPIDEDTFWHAVGMAVGIAVLIAISIAIPIVICCHRRRRNGWNETNAVSTGQRVKNFGRRVSTSFHKKRSPRNPQVVYASEASAQYQQPTDTDIKKQIQVLDRKINHLVDNLNVPQQPTHPQPSSPPINTAHDLPVTWDKMSDQKTPVDLVPLSETHQEYQTIQANFNKTCGSRILGIYRIQNPRLWQAYCVHKTHMVKTNPGICNERTVLYHGTSPDVVNNINTQGFNRSFCGKKRRGIWNGCVLRNKCKLFVTFYLS